MYFKWSFLWKLFVSLTRVFRSSFFYLSTMFLDDHFTWPVLLALLSEACSEPCQTTKMDPFTKVVHGWKSLPIFAKSSILDLFDRVLNTPLSTAKHFIVSIHLFLLWAFYFEPSNVPSTMTELKELFIHNYS